MAKKPHKIEWEKCDHCGRDVELGDLIMCPVCEDGCCDDCIAGKLVMCFRCEEQQEE